MTEVNELGLWLVFAFSIGIAIAIDLGMTSKLRRIFTWVTANRHQHGKPDYGEQQPFKQAILWTIVWIGLAGLFAALILLTMGYGKALEFVTGYTLEKSLSIDNMFVFLLIFSTIGIPYAYQHKVLTVGILSAIAMRIPLILVG